jgi:predicted Zn-dependent protease
MRTSRWLLLGTLIVAACATNPATGRRQLILMSEAEEIALGRQADAEVRQQMGVYQDQALQDYVNRIGQRLAQASSRPNLPWTFTVVDEQAVNAFALPGGFIYLTRGILPFLRNEAELAGVLGHEVGHVDGRHSVEAYSRQTLAGGGLAVAGILVPETQAFQGLASLVARAKERAANAARGRAAAERGAAPRRRQDPGGARRQGTGQPVGARLVLRDAPRGDATGRPGCEGGARCVEIVRAAFVGASRARGHAPVRRRLGR